MKIDALARLERHAKRLAEIAAVLGRYGLADLFGGFKYAWLQDRLKSSDGKSLTEGVTQAARVRMALTEQLGPTSEREVESDYSGSFPSFTVINRWAFPSTRVLLRYTDPNADVGERVPKELIIRYAPTRPV